MLAACLLVHHFGPDRNITTAIGWIVMKLSSDVHVPLRINCWNIGDYLTFHVAPSSGQNLDSSNINNQIPAKLMTSLSASVLLVSRSVSSV